MTADITPPGFESQPQQNVQALPHDPQPYVPPNINVNNGLNNAVPQVVQQVVLVNNINVLPEPACCEVFCMQRTPILERRSFQIPCGVLQVLLGSGMTCSTCCCCYGCSRPSCCAVWCAGFCVQFTSVFVYGIIASIIIGVKMMLV